jgi:hypothetical protein
VSGDDHHPPKNWRELCVTLGPDFAQHPSEWWGRKDWEQVESRNRPINEKLPPVAAAQTVPGFSLFPDRQRPPTTKGERAVQEIRSKLLLDRSFRTGNAL